MCEDCARMPELPQKVVPFLQKILRLLRNKPISQPAQVPDIDALLIYLYIHIFEI